MREKEKKREREDRERKRERVRENDTLNERVILSERNKENGKK